MRVKLQCAIFAQLTHLMHMTTEYFQQQFRRGMN
jgi:hypothetical protein